MSAPTHCPWCGHLDDCQPSTPGTSLHHRMCCLDQYAPACRGSADERAALDRIMREEQEEMSQR